MNTNPILTPHCPLTFISPFSMLKIIQPFFKATAKCTPPLCVRNSEQLMINRLPDKNLVMVTTTFSLSRNDQYVISTSGRIISLYNILTFKKMKSVMPSPPVCTCIIFYPPDNNILIFGMDDSSILIYNICEDEIISKLEGHAKRLGGLGLSTSLNVLVPSDVDTQIDADVVSVNDLAYYYRLFSSGTNKQCESYIVEWNQTEGFVARNYDGLFDTSRNRFLADGDEHLIKFWDMDSDDILDVLDADGDLPARPYLCFNKNGTLLAVSADHNRIKILASDQSILLLHTPASSSDDSSACLTEPNKKLAVNPLPIAFQAGVIPDQSFNISYDKNGKWQTECSNSEMPNYTAKIVEVSRCQSALLTSEYTTDPIRRLVYTSSGDGILLWKWVKSDINLSGNGKAHSSFSKVYRFGMLARRVPPVDFSPRSLNMLPSSTSQMGGFRPVSMRGYNNLQDTRIKGRPSFESRVMPVPLTHRQAIDGSITLKPQGGLARGMARGHPSPNISPMPGPSGFSSRPERVPYSQRKDIGTGYGPRLFAASPLYEHSHEHEHEHYGSRATKSTDYGCERSVLSSPPGQGGPPIYYST